jgi:hypothetical protein
MLDNLTTTTDTQYQHSFVEEVTDDQIYHAAMSEWVAIVATLWDALGKPIEEKRLNTYCQQLRSVPIGLLEIGVNYAIANNTFSNIPPVGKIYEGIRKELNTTINPRPGMDMDEMIEAWTDHKFRNVFVQFK